MGFNRAINSFAPLTALAIIPALAHKSCMCAPEEVWPQAGRERMILPAPVGRMGTPEAVDEAALLGRLDADHVFMMGDNPALPRMPGKPKLLDFFRLRFGDITFRHLLTSAKLCTRCL